MVLEIPPADGGSITGAIMDAWQAALEDVGPAGVDQGKGGNNPTWFPAYKGVPPNGYIVLPCMTYQGYALPRSNLATARLARAYGCRKWLTRWRDLTGSYRVNLLDFLGRCDRLRDYA